MTSGGLGRFDSPLVSDNHSFLISEQMARGTYHTIEAYYVTGLSIRACYLGKNSNK